MSLLLLLRLEVAELKSQVAELTLEVPELSSGELRLTFTTVHVVYNVIQIPCTFISSGAILRLLYSCTLVICEQKNQTINVLTPVW